MLSSLLSSVVIPEVSMTETLFGGVLFAILLFFASRRLGVSNFWAGILSGLLPFLCYLFYSNQHWAGGDVLAIHIAVYMANAGLLMVFGGMQKKKQRMHWAPKIIIGFFVTLVILNATFLSIANFGLPDIVGSLLLPNPADQTLHTGFPGLVPHDQNILYENHLKRIAQQRNLGWDVQIEGLTDLREGKVSNVSIRVLDSRQQPVAHADATLELWRMANSRDDRSIALKETAPGVYGIDLTLPDEGRWVSQVQIDRGEDHYLKQQPLFVDGD